MVPAIVVIILFAAVDAASSLVNDILFVVPIFVINITCPSACATIPVTILSTIPPLARIKDLFPKSQLFASAAKVVGVLDVNFIAGDVTETLSVIA